jgi:uncharacterized membrane protein
MDSSRRINLMIVVLWVIISFVGLIDSGYLSAVHFLGEVPTCTIASGCDKVALSPYATIGPIPVSLLGTLFYLAMLVIGVAWIDSRNNRLLKHLIWLTIPAFFFSIWLIYVMFFEIEAICEYCLLSAASTTVLMGLSVWFARSR